MNPPTPSTTPKTPASPSGPVAEPGRGDTDAKTRDRAAAPDAGKTGAHDSGSDGTGQPQGERPIADVDRKVRPGDA